MSLCEIRRDLIEQALKNPVLRDLIVKEAMRKLEEKPNGN
jgi:hypothetical protein